MAVSCAVEGLFSRPSFSGDIGEGSLLPARLSQSGVQRLALAVLRLAVMEGDSSFLGSELGEFYSDLACVDVGYFREQVVDATPRPYLKLKW